MKPFSAGLFKDARIRVKLIFLLALTVRLVGISLRPIWYDEAYSILFSEKGLGQMLYGTLAPTSAGSADIHPLGYYTLLWGWINVFGKSLIAVRMLSVLAGLATVYLVFQIASELFDIQTAETSALITALAPFHVHYSQEIRMYAFMTLWLLLATYSYLRGMMSGDWRWWLVFGLSSALSQYTHNLVAFFLIPLAVTPLLKRDWRTFRSVLIAGLLAIFLYLPWLNQLPSQFAQVDQSYWVEKPNISSLFTLLLVFTTNTPLPNSWILPSLTIAILIIAIGLRQTVRMNSGSEKNKGLWILYLAFAPPLLIFIFSQWIPVYIERALLPSGAFFCIWVAWTIHRTNLPSGRRGIFIVLLAVGFIAGIYQHVTYRGFPYGPFREITVFLQENAKPGDRIIHSNKLSMLPAMYFDRELAQSFISDPPGSATDTLAAATQQVLGIEAEAGIRSATGDAENVYYIIYRRSISEYIQAGRSTHPDIEYLNSEYRLESQKAWDDLLILYYTQNQ
jgi:4-amino-4-deoxy-L-arabinose transferase-like glycosyltransferase